MGSYRLQRRRARRLIGRRQHRAPTGAVAYDRAHAGAPPVLRMLRPRPAAGLAGRADLHVRVHVLRALRGGAARRSVSQLRRQLREAADPPAGDARQAPRLDGARVRARRLRLSLPALEQALEPLEVLAVLAPHRRGHQRRAHLGEARRLAAVAQRHAGAAVGVRERVGRLHRERALGGAHREALAVDELDDLVGVREPAPEEPRREGDPGAEPRRARRLPLDAVDVRVPPGRVVRIGREGVHVGPRAGDVDLGDHVDGHARSVLRDLGPIAPSDRDPDRHRLAPMTASEYITHQVTSWQGVEAGTGSRGEWSFTVGRREIGHLHGDHAAHFGFPKALWRELYDAGRIDYHPAFPGKEGWASRRIESDADAEDVIAMLRLNYDRVIERYGVPATA